LVGNDDIGLQDAQDAMDDLIQEFGMYTDVVNIIFDEEELTDSDDEEFQETHQDEASNATQFTLQITDNIAHSNINHHSISSSKQKPISTFYISLPSVLYIFLPSLKNNIREALRFATPQNIKDTSWVQLQRPAKDLQANHTIAA